MLDRKKMVPLLLLSLALVCLVAGSAFADGEEKPWEEKPDPTYGGGGGGNGKPEIDDTPWVEPPEPGTGDGRGKEQGGPTGIDPPPSGNGDGNRNGQPDPGLTLADWMWLMLHTASY